MPSDPAPAQSQASAHITAHNLLIPTLSAWKIYLEDQGNSPHTVKAFLADLRLLASFLPPDRTLGNIATTDLNNFLDWMQNNRGVPCSPKTLSRRITSIKAFFRWLHQNGVILIDPAEKVLQKSAISPLPSVLSPKEVESVLQAALAYRYAAKPDARPYVLVALLLATAIKKGECLALSPNHLDFQAPNGPLLFVRYSSPQHRYKERKIALPEEWQSAYEEYTSQYELGEQVFPWSPRRLEYLLEDLGEDAGLDKHLSFDMCRWTCALMDWRSGMDREKLRQKMGVSKIQWRELGMKLEQLSSATE
jgi:integrase/recombinase XerD